MDNRPAENALPNLSATAVAPGSWAYVRRGQPNEETDRKSSIFGKVRQTFLCGA